MVLLWISEEEGGIWVEDARGLEVSLRDAKVALRRSLLPSLLTLELEENAEEKEDGTGGKKLGILVSLRLGFLWIALSLGWQKKTDRRRGILDVYNRPRAAGARAGDF